MHNLINRLWYGKTFPACLLLPLSFIYRIIIYLRRLCLIKCCQQSFTVPVIIVGNLTVGGTGKTPLVIKLAQEFKQKGLRVGIVSRGYKAAIKQFPYEIKDSDEPALVGDEPFLIAKKTACPVVIAPKRAAAVRYLLDKHHCQVIISDDGLQHYRLNRAIEIAVIDGRRGLGNGLTLPAGPLRESKSRLKQVDFIVVNDGYFPNAYTMSLVPEKIIQLLTDKSVELHELIQPVAAVAAIGNPQRFFNTLSQMKIEYNPYPFPDHYSFSSTDLKFTEKQVLMTEKDAVKCRLFAKSDWYYLAVTAQLEQQFWHELWAHESLKGLINEKN